MFQVGKDIFKGGFDGRVGSRPGRVRLKFMRFALVLMLVVFGYETLRLSLDGTSRQRRRASDQEWIVKRADIVDRNGDILAKNVMAGHIAILVKDVKKYNSADEVAQAIHEILPREYSLSDALNLVNRAMTRNKYTYVKKFAKETELVAVKKARVAGLQVETFQKRIYPKRRLFSHIVGTLDKDQKVGETGLERTYNDYLSENSDPLRVSLDARIQAAFHEQLSIAMHKYSAKAAMGMLMDARTGEMIAMVNLPDFDPESSRHTTYFGLMNGAYEMGSTFKIFNTAMAMENGINKEYYVEKPYHIRGKNGQVLTNGRGRPIAPIRDHHSFKPPRPNLSVEEIMFHSCNVGSAQIALDLPDGTQQEFFDRLHLNERLDLELGKTARPRIPPQWGPVERATRSYGHGIAVTPMHLLLGINAVATGGHYIYPTWLKRNVGAINGERVLSSDISARIRAVMFDIVEKGGSKKARVEGFKIGGKTGTAEKYTADGRVDRHNNFTVFVGVFPIDAPQYTMVIMLDEPKGTKESWGLKTAAWNAVPTAGKILDNILPLLFE